MRVALAVVTTICWALVDSTVSSAFAQSFAERIAGGYEVRGFSFLPQSDKGLIMIQRGSSVLQCDFDKILSASEPAIKPGNCRELSN